MQKSVPPTVFQVLDRIRASVGCIGESVQLKVAALPCCGDAPEIHARAY